MNNRLSKNSSTKIFTLPSDLLEELIDTYTDYVTNPYSELRQRNEYFISRVSTGGAVSPLPPECRALRYKYNPTMPNDEEVLVENLPKPQRNATYVQFIVLLDLLYRKCHLEKDEEDDYHPRINASILQEISKHYAYIIYVLQFKDIISGATHSYINIEHPDLFTLEECHHQQIVNRIKAYHDKAFHRWKQRMTEAASLSSNTFIERYNKCLAYYSLDIEKVKPTLNSLPPDKAIWYSQRLHNICNEQSYNHGFLDDVPDINGRWYHIVATTPRLLRTFSNIQYIVDVRNSQLVLFNYFLICYYLDIDISILTSFSKINEDCLSYHLNRFFKENNDISIDEVNYLSISERRKFNIKHGLKSDKYLIEKSIKDNEQFRTHAKLIHLILEHIHNSNIFSSNSNHIYYKHIQYDRKKLCNTLKHNGFRGEILEKVSLIPTSVKRFIYQSSHGILWDSFIRKTGWDRNMVKTEVFKNIFYSYPYSPVPNKEIRDAFKREYRDVYKVLTYYKVRFKEQCDTYGINKFFRKSNSLRLKGLLQLPHKLTQLESSIFYDILRELFKNKQLMVVGIHDAVAVMNDAMTPDEVIKVMNKVYRQYGIVASFKVETP